MKLHDNSSFGGVVIVLSPYPDLLKSERFVESPGTAIGSAQFQVNGAGKAGADLLEQRPADPQPSVGRCDRQVEDLGFAFGHAPGNSETGYRTIAAGEQELVREVIFGGPLCSLGTSGLDLRDARQILGTRAPDDHSGQASVSGIAPACCTTAQYSARTVCRAGIQR